MCTYTNYRYLPEFGWENMAFIKLVRQSTSFNYQASFKKLLLNYRIDRSPARACLGTYLICQLQFTKAWWYARLNSIHVALIKRLEMVFFTYSAKKKTRCYADEFGIIRKHHSNNSSIVGAVPIAIVRHTLGGFLVFTVYRKEMISVHSMLTLTDPFSSAKD